MIAGRNRKQYLNSPEKSKPRREPSTPIIFKRELNNRKETNNFDFKKSKKEILHKLNNLFIPDLDYHKYISMLPISFAGDPNFITKWNSFVDSINDYLNTTTYSRCLTYINEQIDQFKEKNEDLYNDYILDHPQSNKKISSSYQSIQNDLNNLFAQINQSGNPLDIISDFSSAFSNFSNSLNSYFSIYGHTPLELSIQLILEPISNILKCTKSISTLKSDETDFLHFLKAIEDQFPQQKSRIPHTPLQNKNRRNSANINKCFSSPSKKTRKSLDYSKTISLVEQENEFEVKPNYDKMKTENALPIPKFENNKDESNITLNSSDINSHMKSDRRYRISSFLFSDSSDETTNVSQKPTKKFTIAQNQHDQLNKNYTNSPKKANKINQNAVFEMKKGYLSPKKIINRNNQEDENQPIKRINRNTQKDENIPIKRINRNTQEDENIPIKRINRNTQDDILNINKSGVSSKKLNNTRISRDENLLKSIKNNQNDDKKNSTPKKTINRLNKGDDISNIRKQVNNDLDESNLFNSQDEMDRIIISTKKVNNRVNRDDIIIKQNNRISQDVPDIKSKVPKSPVKVKQINKKKNDDISIIRREHKLLKNKINNNGSYSDLNSLKSEIDTLMVDLNELPNSDILMTNIEMMQDLIDLYKADLHSLEDECETESRINTGIEAEDETAAFDNPGLKRSCEILKLKVQKAELQIKENLLYRNTILQTIDNIIEKMQSKKKNLNVEISNEEISNALKLLMVNTQMINDENKKLKSIYQQIQNLPNPITINNAAAYFKMKSTNIEKKRILKNIANLENNLQNIKRSSEFTSIQNLYYSMRTNVDRIEEEIKSINASNSKLMKNITWLSRPDPRYQSKTTIKRIQFDKYEQLREQSKELYTKYFDVQKKKTDELSATEKHEIDMQLEDIQDEYTVAMMEIERLGSTLIQEKLHEKRKMKIRGRKEAAKLVDSVYSNSKLNIEAEKSVMNLEKEFRLKQNSSKQLVSPLKKKSSDLYNEKMNDEESAIKLTEALFECKKVSEILNLIFQNSNEFLAKINTRISSDEQFDSKDRGLNSLINTITMLITQNQSIFQKKIRIFNLQKEIESFKK